MNESIVVALDLTDQDITLIAYAKQIQVFYQTDTVHFVHNIKTSEIDEIIADMMEDVQIRPMILRSLEKKIEAIFTEKDSYKLTLLEGDNTEFGINEWVKQLKKSCTVVLGWKTPENGTGAMAQKLIRMFQGDILLIPKNATFKLDAILVPTDLSSNFSKVKRKIDNLITPLVNTRVQVIKTYNIPSLFFQFIDDKETKQKAEHLILSQYASLQKKLNIPTHWQIKAVYQQGKSVADIIIRENNNLATDIIVLSAKGANTIAAIFLGSTTNELISRDPFQTIYIVK